MGKKKQSGKSPRRLAKQQRREAQRAAKRHSLRRLPISTGPSEPDLVGAAAQYFAGDDSLPDSPDALATVNLRPVSDASEDVVSREVWVLLDHGIDGFTGCQEVQNQ